MGLPPNNAHSWMNPWDDGGMEREIELREFPVVDDDEIEAAEREYEKYLNLGGE